MQLPKFNNPKLFDQAFTHRSYLNESREKVESNERLEFLGDSILSFVVSRHLYVTYPEFNEGMLTNMRSLLVNTKSLAEISGELGLGEHLKLSKGEEDSHGRENQSLLADCYEAFIGALFMDQGLEPAVEFIAQTLFPKAKNFADRDALKDPKSLLQEHVQAQKHASPLYKVLHEEGPAHAKIFTIGVFVNDVLMGEGIGKSKQIAEEGAAKQALEKIKRK
ncbi:MAG TPA: ribonuclease III [Candidatus Saccharimonadales bacterium]|nr:ribonuclease III [Candidatus Saccharimonadales bacterium]